METFHKAFKHYVSEYLYPGGVKYGAIGILFSVNDFNIELNDEQTIIIDKFFD